MSEAHRLASFPRVSPWPHVVFALGIACSGCSDTTLDIFNPDRGLIAYYALDEAQAGSAVLDSSGFGNDGTTSMVPPLPTSAVPPVHFEDPYSLSFDGKSQVVDLGNPDLLNFSGPITICAWINSLADDGFRNIVVHGYVGEFPYLELALRISDGVYQFASWDGFSHGATATIPAGDRGSWVQLCGVYAGTGYSLYRNGALVGASNDMVAPQRLSVPWGIGGRTLIQGIVPERLFLGSIDDVRIYGRALSSAELEALYRR